MSEFLDISYDKESDSVYIYFDKKRDGASHNTIEVDSVYMPESDFSIDMTKDNKIYAIDIISASKCLPDNLIEHLIKKASN